MMAAILNSAILDSAILHKTLTQTNSIWLKLIHSHSTWWCQPSWILPSWIQQFCTKLCLKLIHSDPTWWCQTSWILPSWIQPFWTKKNFTHSFWLNLMMSDILNSAILDSAILNKRNFTHSFWLNLMMSDIYNSAILDSAILNKKKLHSFILTQLDDGSHLKLFHVGMWHCHLGFRHLVIFSQIHSKTLSLHSDSDSN